MLKMAVMLSGSGTTLENLFERIESGDLPAEVAVVISSRKDAYGLTRARNRGVPTYVFPRKKYADLAAYTEAVFGAAREHAAELIVMAGFMVQTGIPEDFRGKILNVHPALIPAFSGKGQYGHYAHEAVIATGVKVSGCTVHFVDEEYDHGPIVMQRTVEVTIDDTPDTLAERVQAAEREAFPEAIKLFAQGRLKIEGTKVRILPA
jgi:formyltetrahydrofolate-dependent phosphoribosylglycinamide formyltransferase